MVDHVKKIGFGTATSFISTGISILASIITVPLFIKAVGSDLYGLFVVVTSVVGFVGLTDFGLSGAITNQIAYLFAEQKKKEISELFSGAMIFFGSLLLGVFVIIAGLFFADIVSASFIFGVEDALVDLTGSLFFILLTFYTINLLFGSLLVSFFKGLNEIPKYNIIQSSYIIVYSISFVVFLLNKPSIISIAFFQGIFFILRVILLYVSAKKLFSWFRFYFKLSLLKRIKPLLKHSFYFFLLMLLSSLITKTDMLVLSHVVGVGMAATFAIGDRIFKLPTSMVTVAASAMPSIAHYFKLNDLSALSKMYSQVLRMNIVFKCAPLLFILVYSKEIISLWVGPEFFGGYYLVSLFFLSYMIYAWVGPHFAFINSMFKHRSEVIPMTVNVIINLGTSIFFAYHIGIIGIILGTVLGNLLTNAIYLPIFLSRQIDIKPFKDLYRVVVSFAIPAIFLVAMHYLNFYILQGIILQLAFATLVMGIYGFVCWMVVLQKNEKQFFIDKSINALRKLGFSTALKS